jgi:hypothetical protein
MAYLDSAADSHGVLVRLGSARGDAHCVDSFQR